MPDSTPLPVAIVLATLLLKELQENQAGDEQAERLVDAIGVWFDHQEKS